MGTKSRHTSLLRKKKLGGETNSQLYQRPVHESGVLTTSTMMRTWRWRSVALVTSRAFVSWVGFCVSVVRFCFCAFVRLCFCAFCIGMEGMVMGGMVMIPTGYFLLFSLFYSMRTISIRPSACAPSACAHQHANTSMHTMC